MNDQVLNILSICCAAFRENGGFVPNTKPYTLFNVVEYTCFPHIRATNIVKQTEIKDDTYIDEQNIPTCTVTPDDTELATEIIDFLMKYMSLEILEFNDDELNSRQEYLKKIFPIFEKNKLSRSDIRNLSKLPEFYIKYKAFKDIKRQTKFVDSNRLGNDGEVLYDLTCEIIHVIKTKHYDGYNITGIINNHLVTWFSPYILSTGTYIIYRAIVKSLDHSYYADKMATRLTSLKGKKITQ